jgi:hypothetical protein
MSNILHISVFLEEFKEFKIKDRNRGNMPEIFSYEEVSSLVRYKSRMIRGQFNK